MLVVGEDCADRACLERALRGAFPSLRLFVATEAAEAIMLLDEILVDCVVAARSIRSGAWASPIRRWMLDRPGMREIPFVAIIGSDGLDFLRWFFDKPAPAASPRTTADKVEAYAAAQNRSPG